ncbi:short-chain dehydrogenase [Alicycliphilus sp. B1]|nr:short-chain dehydrogenase [Alicycliphilus sp. B1]
MTQQLYILTGASRGMGLAMARQLLQPGHTLVCMARHTQPELTTGAPAGAVLEQWTVDLSQASAGSAAAACLGWPRSPPGAMPAPR